MFTKKPGITRGSSDRGKPSSPGPHKKEAALAPGFFTAKQGKELLGIARTAIERYVTKREVLKPKGYDKAFDAKYGLFVTIETFPSKDLRGCIGYPFPDKPLIEAIVSSAISAAMSDPRFRHLTPEELDKIILEVSILSRPKQLECEPKNRPKHINVGKDGLFIEYGPFSGLLLPQVAYEYSWDAEEFLNQVCWKASLEPTMWMDGATRLYTFQAQIFGEETPRGKVIEHTMEVKKK